jgi:hypothetical protein
MKKRTGRHRLFEEQLLKGVLCGSLVLGVSFLATFACLTLSKASSSSSDITANWFAAWGTWAGGFATAAAFLIAGCSVLVTAAHAREDRAAAAHVRESEDKAQARLLIIYKVDDPQGLAGLPTFRIENRSKDLFFDVRVPVVEHPDGRGGVERRTPKDVDAGPVVKFGEYIPDGELLVPFRSRTDEEIWFTQVTVHTTQWQHVRFAVEYADAAGRQWRQHFGGRIERMFPSDAVPVRAADRFQPPSQIRRLTKQEEHDLPLVVGGVAGEEAVRSAAPHLVATWSRVTRIRPPELDFLNGLEPGSVWVEFHYAPAPPREWDEHLRQQLEAAGIAGLNWRRGGPMNSAAVSFEVREEDLEQTVRLVDAAIEFANEGFEANELAAAHAVVNQAAGKTADEDARQARLREQAATLTPPRPYGESSEPKR